MQLRAIIKNIVPISLVHGFRNNIIVCWIIQKKWELSGRIGSPPHRVKQFIIRRYKEKYGARLFMETGTYLGDMVYAQRRVFDSIISIELGEELFIFLLYKKAT